jgi:flagellar biosynthesis protein FlhF
MKVKRFEGKSETVLRQRVYNELGPEAIVLNVKTKPYRGILRWFLRPIVVLTAAFEEHTQLEIELTRKVPGKVADKPSAQSILLGKSSISPEASLMVKKPVEAKPVENDRSVAKVMQSIQTNDQHQRISSLENKLSMTEELLAKVVAQLNIAEQMARGSGKRRYSNGMIQVFYESLIEQGVSPDVAEALLGELDIIDDQEKIDITLIVKIVYNNIIDILSNANIINIDPLPDQRQVAVFMGPTGVGKTTTIAKLSSIFTLSHEMRIGLITADTYRIAAIEQLKTYADILNLDIQVVYNNEEVLSYLEELLPKNEAVLIDTAGRSHRSEENITELKDLLDRISDSKRYLVLSLTTRDHDLLHIIKTYAKVADFDLIFTKLDETTHLGSILNICYATGKKVAYVTFGQNVPDDIEVLKPDLIAKSLLGLTNDNQPYLQGGGLT